MGSRASSLRLTAVILCATALTAGAYFLSSGLHRLWWPVWVAPIPVLLLAPRLSAWHWPACLRTHWPIGNFVGASTANLNSITVCR